MSDDSEVIVMIVQFNWLDVHTLDTLGTGLRHPSEPYDLPRVLQERLVPNRFPLYLVQDR